MDHQDWTPVVVKKHSVHTAIVAKSISPDAVKMRKLENDEIHVKAKMFSSESRKKIIEYRIEHKINQSQLDGLCSFPKNTIQQIESNKRAPSTKELNTLNRVLKTGLTLE